MSSANTSRINVSCASQYTAYGAYGTKCKPLIAISVFLCPEAGITESTGCGVLVAVAVAVGVFFRTGDSFTVGVAVGGSGV